MAWSKLEENQWVDWTTGDIWQREGDEEFIRYSYDDLVTWALQYVTTEP